MYIHAQVQIFRKKYLTQTCMYFSKNMQNDEQTSFVLIRSMHCNLLSLMNFLWHSPSTQLHQ